MTIEDDIAFLQAIPLLRRLGGPALRILAIGTESQRLEPGEVLFTAGDVADGAYIVQRGSFNLQPQHGGDTALVAGPGTLLGESALFAETTRSATATARERTVVMRISRAMFLKMLEGYPEAAQRLREVIAARAEQWAREMESVRATLAPETKPR
jgi:CRP-like cAMP-binding protein